MLEPPPRKRFQFHLSTAIVMMVWIGVMMSFNLIPRIQVEGKTFTASRENMTRTVKEYGWPAPALTQQQYSCKDFDGKIIYGEKWEQSFSYNMVMLNFFWACFQLYGCWLICEWLIRRRAVRK